MRRKMLKLHRTLPSLCGLCLFNRKERKVIPPTTPLKTILRLYPYFGVVSVSAEDAFVAAEPVEARQQMYLVAQSIVGSKAAEPAFVIDVEIGEVGELQRAVEQLLRYVERRQRAVGLL